MRETFPGHHRPSAEEFAELWSEALIVPDTNVLLTLYRLPEDTRGKLLEILGGLKERLFVPYQVGVEFQRGRLAVIDEQMKTYAEVEEAIKGFATAVGKEVREHPRLDREDLEGRITKALAPVKRHLDKLRDGHPDPLTDGDPLGADTVRDALEPLLAGRVGEPSDLADVAKDGSKRYAHKVPPGWADEKKPDPERYGDLVIWLDVIDRAKDEDKPVILVTEDRKEDWWWIRNGKTIGPQPQLVEEMQEKADQRFWMYTLGPFMEEAAKFLGIELKDAERDDVERAESAAQREHLVLSDDLTRRFDPGMTFATFGGTGARLPLASGIAPGQIVYTSPEKLRQGSFVSPGWPVNQGWMARVEVGEESALLAIEWQPNFLSTLGQQRPVNRLLCRVSGPDGVPHAAIRRGTNFSAAFRYPDNFEGAEAAEPGSYSYSWYFRSADQDDLGEEVASGIFEIPSTAD